MAGTYIPCAQLATIVAAHRAQLGDGACVAFVLAPGGAAGAYQAGAIEALGEHGLRPDLLIGTSSGALNALGWVLDLLVPPDPRRHWPAGRLARLWRHLSHPEVGARALVDLPHVLGFIAGKEGVGLGLASEVFGHLAHPLASWEALQRGFFSHGPLRALLLEAVTAALAPGATTPETAGEALLAAWHDQHAPGLLMLATDTQSHLCVPFLLGDPAFAARLEARHHAVRHLGAGSLAGEHVLEAFLASAAIPGAFPAIALPAEAPGWPPRRYLDGAIAASEPFHLAIDAGATLIISLEVTPFARPPRPDGSAGRHPLSLAADSLMAIQERYQRADARGLAAWNTRLAGGEVVGRRQVPLYRLAPSHPGIGLLDFDGRHANGARTLSLFDWLMEGYRDAGGDAEAATAAHLHGRDRRGDVALVERRHGPGFWEATWRPQPGPLPPPTAG